MILTSEVTIGKLSFFLSYFRRSLHFSPISTNIGTAYAQKCSTFSGGCYLVSASCFDSEIKRDAASSGLIIFDSLLKAEEFLFEIKWHQYVLFPKCRVECLLLT